MLTFYQRRLKKLDEQGRVKMVHKSDGNGLLSPETIIELIDRVSFLLKTELSLDDPYPAMEINNFRHRLGRTLSKANKAYIIQNKGMWNEVHFAFFSASNRKLYLVSRLTYKTKEGWTAHLGNVGGLVRLALFTHEMSKSNSTEDDDINELINRGEY